MKTVLLLALLPLALGWPSGGGDWGNPWGRKDNPDKQDKGDDDSWMEAMWKKFMEESGGKLEFEGTISMQSDDDKDKDWGDKQQMKGWGGWGKRDDDKDWGDKQMMKGWGGWGKRDDDKDWGDKQMMTGWGKRDDDKDWGDKQMMRGWGKRDDDKDWGDKQQMRGWGGWGKRDDDKRGGDDMMKMFGEFKEWARAKRWKQEMWEEKKKEMMADKFEEWKKFQMMQHMKEWKEEMEEEKREKEMEALRHKHMMVQKMANITEQFQHQKLKLVHDVTSQFLEFCKCSQTSDMLKRFFTETFGQMSRDDDWSMGVKDVWGEDDDRWGNDMKDMGGRMNSSMGNSTTPGNGTRGNNSTGGNMGGDSTEDYEQWAERQKMEMKAQKFYRMNQKERSMELFHGMVKALCQRAGEYVDHVKKFESFYVKYVADWERSHN